MGRLVDYPADWGTPGADRMTGLALPFKAVPAGSEGALITELRASTEKKSPLLITFWQPHWAMSAYDVQFVDLPAGEDACFTDASWGPQPQCGQRLRLCAQPDLQGRLGRHQRTSGPPPTRS